MNQEDRKKAHEEAMKRREANTERRKAELKADPSKAKDIADVLLLGEHEYLGGGMLKRKEKKEKGGFERVEGCPCKDCSPEKKEGE